MVAAEPVVFGLQVLRSVMSLGFFTPSSMSHLRGTYGSGAWVGMVMVRCSKFIQSRRMCPTSSSRKPLNAISEMIV